jgi:hypothetical protein
MVSCGEPGRLNTGVALLHEQCIYTCGRGAPEGIPHSLHRHTAAAALAVQFLLLNILINSISYRRLTAALTRRPRPGLRRVDLSSNSIDHEGAASLAGALEAGALPRLEVNLIIPKL